MAVTLPELGPKRVQHGHVGVNFSDMYVRRGVYYPQPYDPSPVTLGNKAVGVAAETGAGGRFRSLGLCGDGLKILPEHRRRCGS